MPNSGKPEFGCGESETGTLDGAEARGAFRKIEIR
jgi:hypothetical protein